MIGWLRKLWRRRLIRQEGRWKDRWARCPCGRRYRRRGFFPHLLVWCDCGVGIIFRPPPMPVEYLRPPPKLDLSDLNALLALIAEQAYRERPTAYQMIDEGPV